jgi:hypothetical protein
VIIEFPKAGSLPSQRSRRTIDAARPVAASLQRRGTFPARNAPNAQAQSVSGRLQRPANQPNARREAGRATYIPRRQMLVAICVTWAAAFCAALAWVLS